MSISFNNNGIANKLARNLEKAQTQRADAMEKLSSGKIFSTLDPQPAARALTEQMDFRLRGLSAAKRNINDAVSLLQTAESGLSEINNIIVRMKELNVSAATTTITDRERRYLLIEYQALHEEVNRIAQTTEFNGMPLLNGADERTPEELIFRVDDPMISDEFSSEDDINMIRFDGIKEIVATAEGLGLGDASSLLKGSASDEGISLEDVEDLLLPSDENFSTSFDQALHTLSNQRAIYGAMQSRLQRSMEFVEVYHENISAAKASVSDTDYAREIVNLTKSNILMQASSSLLAQSNFDANLTLNLLSSVSR